MINLNYNERTPICSNLKKVFKLLNLSVELVAIKIGVRAKTVEMWCYESYYGFHSISCKNFDKLRYLIEEECETLYGVKNGFDVAFEEMDLDFPDLVEGIVEARLLQKT